MPFEGREQKFGPPVGVESVKVGEKPPEKLGERKPEGRAETGGEVVPLEKPVSSQKFEVPTLPEEKPKAKEDLTQEQIEAIFREIDAAYEEIRKIGEAARKEALDQLKKRLGPQEFMTSVERDRELEMRRKEFAQKQKQLKEAVANFSGKDPRALETALRTIQGHVQIREEWLRKLEESRQRYGDQSSISDKVKLFEGQKRDFEKILDERPLLRSWIGSELQDCLDAVATQRGEVGFNNLQKALLYKKALNSFE